LDLFLAEKYTAVFKAIICILERLEDELLKNNFEGILDILGNLHEREIFKNSNYKLFLEL